MVSSEYLNEVQKKNLRPNPIYLPRVDVATMQPQIREQVYLEEASKTTPSLTVQKAHYPFLFSQLKMSSKTAVHPSFSLCLCVCVTASVLYLHSHLPSYTANNGCKYLQINNCKLLICK